MLRAPSHFPTTEYRHEAAVVSREHRMKWVVILGDHYHWPLPWECMYSPTYHNQQIHTVLHITINRYIQSYISQSTDTYSPTYHNQQIHTVLHITVNRYVQSYISQSTDTYSPTCHSQTDTYSPTYHSQTDTYSPTYHNQQISLFKDQKNTKMSHSLFKWSLVCRLWFIAESLTHLCVTLLTLT